MKQFVTIARCKGWVFAAQRNATHLEDSSNDVDEGVRVGGVVPVVGCRKITQFSVSCEFIGGRGIND